MVSEKPTAESIFLAAVELAPDQRTAYLKEACGIDRELLARVERLLAAQSQIGNFLESPAPELGATISHGVIEQPGTVIGPYKLLQQIGEGGMGVVFMAEQERPVQRTVALKIIKPGMDTRQVIARFEAERQALAMMDHPNIAKVLDAGTTETGRPYFVMELVKGIPITKYCDEKQLSLRERLELFLPTCQALQHAHQKGIIHRDIKPTNVLVAEYDNDALPKVIDFGVAKATAQKLTERTMFTEFGQLIGTVEYMSPEQAKLNQLDIDTRSDIYSLGVLLYELLTGTTPLERKRLHEVAFDEMLWIIREEQPPKPSARLTTLAQHAASTVSIQRSSNPHRLVMLVRGELDWIVMKCLDKDRNRRYESANSLAADINRYLRDEPVQAYPPSAAYRFRKFAQRNSIAVALAAAIAVTLVLGIVGTAWQAIRATAERNRAVKAEQQSDVNFEQARKTVDEYFIAISESTLLDKPGLEPLRKELLERGLKYYQQLLNQKEEDPQLQAAVAGTYLRMSVVYIMIDAGDEAFSALQTGLELVDKLIRLNPNDDKYKSTLAGYWNVERHFYSPRTSGPNLSNAYKGLSTLKQAIEMWEAFVHDNPTYPAFRNDLAAFWTYRGDLIYSLGDHADALDAYARAAELRETLVRENPRSREYRAALGESRTGLAWMQQHCGHPQDAEKTYIQAVELHEQLVKEFPEVPVYRVGLANTYRNFCTLVRATNRLIEAEQYNSRALEILEELVADFPDVAAFKIELSINQRELAEVLAAANRADEADEAYLRSIALGERLATKFPDQPNYGKELGWTYLSAGDQMAKTGRLEDANKAYSQALFHFEKYLVAFPHMVKYRRILNEIRSKQNNLRKSGASAPKLRD